MNQARTDAKILRETKMKKKRTAGTKIHNERMLHQRKSRLLTAKFNI